MITLLTIGLLPVTFSFTRNDIIKVDEKAKVIVLADTVTRVYKDTLDDGDGTTEDTTFENTFPTLRQIILPYDGASVNGEPLFDYIKNNMSVGFNLDIQASADSVSDSKIVLSATGVSVTTAP